MGPRILSTMALAAILLGVAALDTTAEAQAFASARTAFRVESSPGTFARAPAVAGFIYNDGLRRLSNVRLMVEVLDADGGVVEEVFGWVVGDLAPRGRGYFLIPVTKLGVTQRVSILSYNVDSEGSIDIPDRGAARTR